MPDKPKQPKPKPEPGYPLNTEDVLRRVMQVPPKDQQKAEAKKPKPG